MRKFLIAISITLLTACTGVPEGITPVNNFQLDQYLGTWYEIARLDHPFERDLSQVSAEYALLDNGQVEVRNKGFSSRTQETDTIVGSAKFVGEENVGHLKVSFFGPFYSSYVIFKLDDVNYQYAFVTGFNKDYLWLLSRTPTVSEELKTEFVDQAKSLGYDTESLIFVDQSSNIE